MCVTEAPREEWSLLTAVTCGRRFNCAASTILPKPCASIETRLSGRTSQVGGSTTADI